MRFETKIPKLVERFSQYFNSVDMRFLLAVIVFVSVAPALPQPSPDTVNIVSPHLPQGDMTQAVMQSENMDANLDAGN